MVRYSFYLRLLWIQLNKKIMAKLIKIFGAVFLILAVLIIFRAVRNKNTVSISPTPSPSVPTSVSPSSPPSAFQSYSLAINGTKRTYNIFIPSSYSNNSNEKYPLVIVFHGGGGSGVRIAKQTNFNQTAQKEGIIVVYPDAIKHNWNDGRGVTEAEKMGIDDIAFCKSSNQQNNL